MKTKELYSDCFVIVNEDGDLYCAAKDLETANKIIEEEKKNWNNNLTVAKINLVSFVEEFE